MMASVRIKLNHQELYSFDDDVEFIEFILGDRLSIDRIQRGYRGDLTICLSTLNGEVFIARDGWTIRIVDDEAKVAAGWERCYPPLPTEEGPDVP